MTSIYDLVYDYIGRFYPGVAVKKETKNAIHKEIKRLLQRGWCAVDIQRRFQQVGKSSVMAAQVKIRVGTNVRKLFQNMEPETINLITPDTFYYHNVLRITSKPPKRKFDIEAGEFIVMNDPYFLEMRASFTVDDLVAYYCKQFDLKVHRQEYSRFTGSFNWLLRMDDVEIILFMIDTAANIVKEGDYPAPRTPMDIRKYRREAMEIRNLKETEAVMSGGNKIVRRKRTHPS